MDTTGIYLTLRASLGYKGIIEVFYTGKLFEWAQILENPFLQLSFYIRGKENENKEAS